MQQPLVSIIIPCYNQAQFLGEAVASVLAQTYQNWEGIIVNDGSPDNTEELALALVKGDDRLRYYKKENGGISDARNFGIQRAAGKYVLPLDGDDKIAPEYLKLAVQEIEKDEEIKVVYCDVELFGLLAQKWVLAPFSLEELARNNMIVNTALFRKREWEKTGGYDVTMKIGFEDWEFWISVLKEGGKVVKLPYTGFFYRIKSVSRAQSITVPQWRQVEDYIFKKHFNFILEQLGNPIYLNRELKKYKSSYERIAGTLPYRLYKRLKLKIYKVTKTVL